ncbi:unnamed protein product [Amoebophrya sp. A25]|nr:unnamed protein product [Amoebophrya sp. A25]|eukprot:GSA25T00011170001.1
MPHMLEMAAARPPVPGKTRVSPSPPHHAPTMLQAPRAGKLSTNTALVREANGKLMRIGKDLAGLEVAGVVNEHGHIQTAIALLLGCGEGVIAPWPPAGYAYQPMISVEERVYLEIVRVLANEQETQYRGFLSEGDFVPILSDLSEHASLLYPDISKWVKNHHLSSYLLEKFPVHFLCYLTPWNDGIEKASSTAARVFMASGDSKTACYPPKTIHIPDAASRTGLREGSPYISLLNHVVHIAIAKVLPLRQATNGAMDFVDIQAAACLLEHNGETQPCSNVDVFRAHAGGVLSLTKEALRTLNAFPGRMKWHSGYLEMAQNVAREEMSLNLPGAFHFLGFSDTGRKDGDYIQKKTTEAWLANRGVVCNTRPVGEWNNPKWYAGDFLLEGEMEALSTSIVGLAFELRDRLEGRGGACGLPQGSSAVSVGVFTVAAASLVPSNGRRRFQLLPESGPWADVLRCLSEELVGEEGCCRSTDLLERYQTVRYDVINVKEAEGYNADQIRKINRWKITKDNPSKYIAYLANAVAFFKERTPIGQGGDAQALKPGVIIADGLFDISGGNGSRELTDKVHTSFMRRFTATRNEIFFRWSQEELPEPELGETSSTRPWNDPTWYRAIGDGASEARETNRDLVAAISDAVELIRMTQKSEEEKYQRIKDFLATNGNNAYRLAADWLWKAQATPQKYLRWFPKRLEFGTEYLKNLDDFITEHANRLLDPTVSVLNTEALNARFSVMKLRKLLRNQSGAQQLEVPSSLSELATTAYEEAARFAVDAAAEVSVVATIPFKKLGTVLTIPPSQFETFTLAILLLVATYPLLMWCWSRWRCRSCHRREPRNVEGNAETPLHEGSTLPRYSAVANEG